MYISTPDGKKMVSYCYGKLGALDKVYYVSSADRNLISVVYLTERGMGMYPSKILRHS
jgi:hypothetical protein